MDRDEWLKQRKKGIGGSDAAVVAGISPYKTPLELYLEKTGESEGQDLSNNEAVYWGTVLEDIVAQEYARRKNVSVRRRNNILTHRKYPYILATLDRTVDGQKRLLECKTADRFTADQWGGAGTNDVPEYYQLQVQHYLAVTGYDVADLAVLIGGNDFRIYEIPADKELIEMLIQLESKFWDQVIKRTPPKPINNSDALLAYQQANGQSIFTTDAIYEAYLKLLEIKGLQKELEIKRDKLEFSIKDYMAEHDQLHDVTGNKIVTWKEQCTKRFQVTKFKEENPELYQHYIAEQQTRVLRTRQP